MQLDNLQINSDGKITVSTSLAHQVEKSWKRDQQFAAVVIGGGGSRRVVGGWNTMGTRGLDRNCLGLFGQAQVLMAELGRRVSCKAPAGARYSKHFPLSPCTAGKAELCCQTSWVLTGVETHLPRVSQPCQWGGLLSHAPDLVFGFSPEKVLIVVQTPSYIYCMGYLFSLQLLVLKKWMPLLVARLERVICCSCHIMPNEQVP